MLWHIYIRRKKRNNTPKQKFRKIQQQNNTHMQAHRERKNDINMDKDI